MIRDMTPEIPESKWAQYCLSPVMDPIGVTVHNAQAKAATCIEQMLTSQESYAAHIFADSEEVRLALPLDRGCYHTGKLCDGDRKTIAIEICQSMDTEAIYLAAEQRAVEILGELGLPIYWHSDFDPRTTCPHRVREIYGNRKNFIRHYGLEDLCHL